jgi:hypothetical protein
MKMPGSGAARHSMFWSLIASAQCDPAEAGFSIC